jgi:hypothetical protein
MYNKPETFEFFLDYMEKQELRTATPKITEVLDKRRERNRASKRDFKRFKESLMRRQMTIN